MASITKVRLRRYNGTDYDSVYLSANVGDVVGTLPVTNGGTGSGTAGGSIYNLVNPLDTLTEMTLADDDCLPVSDISATTGKKITMTGINSYIVNYCIATIRVTSPAGTAVVVTYGGETVSVHTGTGSPVNVSVNQKGTWTLTGTLDGESASADVEITSDGVYDAKIVFFVNPLNTDQLTLGMNTVYFKEYPNIKWCVDHLDGDYVYLGAYNFNDGTTQFGSSTGYIGSTIATKCTTFLNNTIPNVADYLETVTVHRAANKVFIPTYYQFSGITGYGDDFGPVFSYPSASSDNRKACFEALDSNLMWLSTANSSSYVWHLNRQGNFSYNPPSSKFGFRPEVKVRYKKAPFRGNPLNTDQITLGDGTIYFTDYPSLKWQVQHVASNYAYLSLTEMTEKTTFGSNATYIGSTIAAKCTDFLNDTIPNVADYLESVTVNGVTNKVFIPSYKMFSGTVNPYGGDAGDPTFDWPSASASNRICYYQGENTAYWFSSPSNYSSNVWGALANGNINGNFNPASTVGFRPCVKVQFKSFVNPLNTDRLTLGQRDVYFKDYPDLKWCVDHIDGKYAYLGLYNASEKTLFGNYTSYSGSTIATKCTTFLNNTIPNVASYLESVTVEGVTNKVFIPTYYQFSGQTGYGDTSGPVFAYMSASANNRAACVSNWSVIGSAFWLSSRYGSNSVCLVANGGILGDNYPNLSIGFRPEVKVRYKE